MDNSNPTYEVAPATAQNPGDLAITIVARLLFDDPSFDVMAWIGTIEFLPEPMVLLRNEFVEWADTAGFANIEMCFESEDKHWEFRCSRGTNAECTTPYQAERWLGFIARGCGCQFVPGHFIAIVIGNSIATRFRLEPRKQHG